MLTCCAVQCRSRRGRRSALGDRLLGDPPVSPARRRRLRKLWPVQVLDRVDLGQEELFRQLVAAVHFDLHGREKFDNNANSRYDGAGSPLVKSTFCPGGRQDAVLRHAT